MTPAPAALKIRDFPFLIKNRLRGQKQITKIHKISICRFRKIDLGCQKRPQMIPRTKQKIEKQNHFSTKNHTKPICSSKMTIVSLR